MNLYKILLALLILSLLAACSSDKENDVYTTLPFSLSIYQVCAPRGEVNNALRKTNNANWKFRVDILVEM